MAPRRITSLTSLRPLSSSRHFVTSLASSRPSPLYLLRRRQDLSSRHVTSPHHVPHILTSRPSSRPPLRHVPLPPHVPYLVTSPRLGSCPQLRVLLRRGVQAGVCTRWAATTAATSSTPSSPTTPPQAHPAPPPPSPRPPPRATVPVPPHRGGGARAKCGSPTAWQPRFCGGRGLAGPFGKWARDGGPATPGGRGPKCGCVDRAQAGNGGSAAQAGGGGSAAQAGGGGSAGLAGGGGSAGLAGRGRLMKGGGAGAGDGHPSQPEPARGRPAGLPEAPERPG